LAEVTTETIPGQVFKGEVDRVVHEANIQRNTVQMKVKLLETNPGMKPEMLCRVRLLPPKPDEHPAPGEAAPAAGGEVAGLMVLPRGVVEPTGQNQARVWVVELASGGPRAAQRTLTLAGEGAEGEVFITEGVRLGDRVIADPRGGLSPGARVRVLGEAEQP
jgi:hypothetical protein